MKTLIVANNNGAMPPNYNKKLRALAKYNWQYQPQAKCHYAEINDTEEATFVAMKIIAAITPEHPGYYCTYLDDRTTLFHYDKQNGYIKTNNKS